MLLVLLPLGLTAQEQGANTSTESTTHNSSSQKSPSKIFTGFSGGMMLHGGYLFSDDPRKVFSNTGLGSYDYWKGLPKSGLCYGLGGCLRVHLIDHIHLGAEGGVSTMPLMGTGSNVRSGWGGALCDFYSNWGKTRPLIGLSIGGGTMKRLFVPTDSIGYEPVETASGDTTNYNASYVKTPFFFLDPYVGVEINLNNHMAILIRLDYMLPFGRTSSGLTNLGTEINWGNFMTPSGPRLYVGIMFGRLKRQ